MFVSWSTSGQGTWPEVLGQVTNIPSCRTAGAEIQHKIRKVGLEEKRDLRWNKETWITTWNVCNWPASGQGTWPEALGQVTKISSCRTARTAIWHKIKKVRFSTILEIGIEQGMGLESEQYKLGLQLGMFLRFLWLGLKHWSTYKDSKLQDCRNWDLT